MNSKMKSLILIFIVSLQICFIFYFLLIPKYSYISYYHIENSFNKTSSNINDLFPNFNIYRNNEYSNLKELFRSNSKTVVLFNGCNCKDTQLREWISNAEDLDIPVVYIYRSWDDYKINKVEKKYKNVKVFLSSTYDIISFISQEDINNLPVKYIVSNEGFIIAKEK